ncbi:uncharacterized protein LOC126833833 [Adelges cooleyi]|uniref:uncharacterized protein LOC126833833 n=1 Tax=Adelges cooleyi TaxID=133065 RepID=UPI00217FFF3B|nr:uncharacterized protein LOC126833833 [Adelges cooleyi]
MKLTKTIKYFKLNAYRYRRRLVFGFIVVVLVCTLMARHKNKVKFVSSEMIEAQPQDVWEYVSDFSNMMTLNPTIKKFTITHEAANFKEWNYTVEYEEHLSQIPFVTNKIVGEFVIYKISQLHYNINSTHRTCFSNFFCLHTDSEMQFLKSSQNNRSGTRVVETIEYECPWALTGFCLNEVKYQRNKIFGQLRRTDFPKDQH